MNQIGGRHGKSPAHVMRAGTCSTAAPRSQSRSSRPASQWIVPIPGTTVMAHMLENSGAADVRFTPAELAELNAAVRAIEIRGQRLPDQVLVFSGVEAPPKSVRPGSPR